jgi:glycosyltransferase involved in cell wall biosynthesis
VHSPVVQEQRINWNNGTLAGRLKLLLGLPVLRRAERDALARASAVHVLSTFTATELERQYGREATKRIRVIPWWPDHPWEILPREEARRRFGLPAGERVFLSIRRMVPRMGLRLLLDAAEGLGRDRPFKLLLAGDGPERTALEARARTERLRDRVVFLGRVSDEVAGWAYDACEAFVLPSLSLECFGIIVLEALAHGRPVIGSRVGAIPELLGPVLPDWLFEAGDSTALRNKLEAVLEGRLKAPSPDALEAHVAREFSIDRLSPRYISLLSSEGAGG